MGKRDTIESNNITVKPKSPRDYYATIDPDAIKPLLPYIKGSKYAEPCAGSGDLIKLIGGNAECLWKSDIHQQEDKSIYRRDATTIDLNTFLGVDYIITNPPFSKKLLLPIMDHLIKSNKSLWLLLPADMMHNKYMIPYMDKCGLVLSVGRLCWFPDEITGKMVKGTDNYCWYQFVNRRRSTIFKGRMKDE